MLELAAAGGVVTLSWAQRNRALRALRDAARRSGVSTARAELRVAWMALAAISATGGPKGGRASRPLQLASETIAATVRGQLGPRWGISRATADAALGELRDDGLVDWPTPAPVLTVTDDGGTACVGREVREVFLTSGAWAIVRDALGRLNPEISGVTEPSAAAAPVPGGPPAAARRGTTMSAGPPGTLDDAIAGFLRFATRNTAPF